MYVTLKEYREIFFYKLCLPAPQGGGGQCNLHSPQHWLIAWHLIKF